MYKVLLVDDEPIVLSGIKFLIDWESLDCQIESTARTGKQALEIIENQHPDIVVCDINMPNMTGLELIKQVSKKAFAPAFIMLTNHQEFDMARESLRYKAVDYLLKTQLEPEVLEKAVLAAIEECKKKQKEASIQIVDDALKVSKKKMAAEYLTKIYIQKDYVDLKVEIDWMNQYFALSRGYVMLQIHIDYSKLPQESLFSEQDKKRIFECEHEYIEALLPKFFSEYLLFYPSQNHDSFMLCIWKIDNKDYKTLLAHFFEKLSISSEKVTAAGIYFFVTELFWKTEEIQEAFMQLREMENVYYREVQDIIFYEGQPDIVFETIEIKNYISKLSFEMRMKNISKCISYMEKIKEEFSSTNHSREEAIRVCQEIYGTICLIIHGITEEEKQNIFFWDAYHIVNKINRLSTYRQVEEWLEEFKRQLVNALEQITSSKSEILKKVKQYVLENVDKRIMLQDVAEYISISPSYLSALFKKQYNQNLVDYINQCKMDRACEMIREGDYRIYEISLELGFENAYYFTKVFKKHIGMTPKEYQYKIGGRSEKMQ